MVALLVLVYVSFNLGYSIGRNNQKWDDFKSHQRYDSIKSVELTTHYFELGYVNGALDQLKNGRITIESMATARFKVKIKLK